MLKCPHAPIVSATIYNMRKKVEYVNKNFRLDKDLSDRLGTMSRESGVTEKHALNEAVRVLLAAKGY